MLRVDQDTELRGVAEVPRSIVECEEGNDAIVDMNLREDLAVVQRAARQHRNRVDGRGGQLTGQLDAVTDVERGRRELALVGDRACLFARRPTADVERDQHRDDQGHTLAGERPATASPIPRRVRFRILRTAAMPKPSARRLPPTIPKISDVIAKPSTDARVAAGAYQPPLG